jgi:hypothetical protein
MSNRLKARLDLDDPNINLVSLEDGSVISQRVADLIETIHETWGGRVQVNWIPARALKPNDQQFVLVEVLPDGTEHPIFWVKDESEFTGEVLERLFMADNSQGNVLTRMQARNEALRVLQKKVAKDKMEEANDIVKHAIASPLNWYKLPNGTVIKDNGNRYR